MPPGRDPASDIRREENVLLGLVLLVGAALWLAFIRSTHVRLEDALITFRYAENLGQGRGFVYNPGEHVLATTTVLFTLVLARSQRC